MRLILICLMFVVTAIAAVMALLSSDTIFFTGNGFSGSTSPAALVFFAVSAILATSLVWMALATLADLPWPALSSRSTTRRRAHDALARGLIAVEAGDGAGATKYAIRAERLIARQHKHARKFDRAMSLLLAARAAQTNQDWPGAERAYAALAREKGANLAGLRGLAAAAITRGDRTGAAEHVNTAMLANKHLTWPLFHLFDLQLTAGEWADAGNTLELGVKRKLIPADIADRRRCALLSALAAGHLLDAPEKAASHLDSALKADAAFPPAADMAARMKIVSGHPDTARRILRTAWRKTPHPALAVIWNQVRPENTSTHDHLRALAHTNPDHRNSRILMAEALISSGDWAKADALLAPLIGQQYTDRLCSLMEMIARGRGDTDTAAHWARTAMRSTVEREWHSPDSASHASGSSFTYTNHEWATLIVSYGDSGVFSDPRYSARSEARLAFGLLAALPDKQPDTARPPLPDHVPSP